MKISKILSNIYNIDHTTAFYTYFSSICNCRINNLLYSVYIRSKCCNYNSAVLIIIKYLVKCTSYSSL